MASSRRSSSRRAARAQPNARASTSDSGNETDQIDEVEWEVEQVVGKRFGAEGEPSYLLKWKNWQGEATWEPAENCAGCSRLINEYETKISPSSSSSSSARSSSRRDDSVAAGPSTRQPSSNLRSKVTPKRK